MIDTKTLEENIKQLNEQYYNSLKRIAQLHEELFGLKQVQEAATDLVKEISTSNLTLVIESNRLIIEHLESLKQLLSKR